MERLDKVLSSTGCYSRREVKELVRSGRVRLDGVPAAAPEQKIDPETASLTVDGEAVSAARYVYLMLHKPGGVLTATEDKRRKTVLDLLPELYRKRGCAPVGRLDKDTEGLLLLTDDGELAHRLLSPRYHVDKVYLARVDVPVDAADEAAFAGGMTLADGTRCMPAGLEKLGNDTCLVTLREGKFHQVKRMLAQRGKTVLYLKRLAMGPLQLDDALAPGAWRPLRPEELLTVKMTCGM